MKGPASQGLLKAGAPPCKWAPLRSALLGGSFTSLNRPSFWRPASLPNVTVWSETGPWLHSLGLSWFQPRLGACSVVLRLLPQSFIAQHLKLLY